VVSKPVDLSYTDYFHKRKDHNVIDATVLISVRLEKYIHALNIVFFRRESTTVPPTGTSLRETSHITYAACHNGILHTFYDLFPRSDLPAGVPILLYKKTV